MTFALRHFPFDFAQEKWLEVGEFAIDLINCHEHIGIFGSTGIS